MFTVIPLTVSQVKILSVKAPCLL